LFKLSQTGAGRCYVIVSAQPNVVTGARAGDEPFDFDAVFRAHYPRLARIVARITGDPARAEELAVEALWKLWRSPEAHGEGAGGWLYRTAVRMGLNELRGSMRRARHESLAELTASVPDPEQARAAAEERRQVRDVLTAIDPRQAALLVLRTSGLSYEEIASALELNPASVGTFLSRAQQAFRKEYVKRYGPQ
jgi:RNA polymerase sigma-70 factor, ECF subfamily